MKTLPNPRTGPWPAIDRTLVQLQRKYSLASDGIAAGVVPEGIEPATLDWWREAWQSHQSRSEREPGTVILQSRITG